MAQQNEGWPLGLQPLNTRIELVRNRDNSGSISFNTLLTSSDLPSTDTSSDLDTQSTGSFFRDKSTTLGSLMGVSSIVEPFRRSTRGGANKKDKKKFNLMSCLFCLWSRNNTNKYGSQKNINPPSLGEFLAVERRAAGNGNRRSQNTLLAEINNAKPSSLVCKWHHCSFSNRERKYANRAQRKSNVDKLP